MKTVYIMGSLRNPEVPKVAEFVRSLGYEAFASWYAGGPIADDCWQAYEQGRGLTYIQALADYHARHVFNFDLHHICRADAGVLIYPAGKSAHLELGYIAGQGKPTFILLDKEPDRWDIMLQFADGGVHLNTKDLGRALRRGLGRGRR